MKKLVVLLFLISSVICFGQNREALKDIPAIKFYGIDYSLVKVYGAAEPSSRFKETFGKINELFITEPNKFDVSKYTGMKVKEVSLDAVNAVNNKISTYTLTTTNRDYSLNEKQITDLVKALPIVQEPGTGLVLVAMLLNKADNRGSYQVVFFNTETKEIISNWPTLGKAGGAGLRNFWANSVYKVLKTMK